MSNSITQPLPSLDGDSVIAQLKKLVSELADLMKDAVGPKWRGLARLASRLRQLLDDFPASGVLSASRSDQHEVLTRILASGKEIFNFDCGVIYFADELHQELICLAEIGFAAGAHRPPTCKFSDTSFVGTVRATGESLFTSNPLGDPVLYPPGKTYFQFKTGLVGVPLKTEGRVLGVLAVWGNKPPGPSENLKVLLRPFADFAASYLALSIREAKFVDLQLALNETLSWTAAERDEISVRESIMRGVRSFPFDRVRFFDHDPYSRSFVPLDCLGKMDIDRFLRLRISASQNPYAKHTCETYRNLPHRDLARVYVPQQGREAIEKKEPFNSRSHVYLGPIDPDHNNIQKPAELPWAVAPLVLGEELIGQIVADNADNKSAITEDHLAFLNSMAALAVGVVVNRRSVKFLSYENLPDLYHWLTSSHSRLAVIRRLLAYLTCGEALGFSRAVFFEWHSDPPRLVYRASVGSLREEDFRHIGEAVRFLPLSDILREAPDVEDYDIHEALNGYVIPLQEPDAQDLLKRVKKVIPAASESWAAALAPLGQGPFLTAPLQADGRLLGLFLVDRFWQPNPHRDLDEPALRTFAHLAAQALAEHDLRTREAHKEDEDQLTSVAIFIGHEFTDHVNDIGLCMLPLEQAIKRGNACAALEKVECIRTSLEKLEQSRKGLMSLVGRPPVLEAIRLRPLIDEVCQSDPSWNLRPDVDCPTDLRVMGDEGQLRICFQELIRNSQFWLKLCKKADSDRRIFITVSTPSVMAIPAVLDLGQKYALIHFEDTGDGIDPEDLKKVFDLGFSKRPKEMRPEERGIGLYMVSRIIALHKGMIKSGGQFGEGACFAIFLPLFSSPNWRSDAGRGQRDTSYPEAL